jgi:two-component system sensor histidine kinase VicK
MEFRITSKDTEQWICLTLYSIGEGNENRPQLLAMAEDITKRKEYELCVLRHNAKKNSILNILSHDLRGPLSAIGLASGMLREQRQKGILGDGDDLTGMIERTCTQALELINQYVDSEMLESSDIGVKRTRVEIVGRVSSIIDTFKITDGHPGRTFILEAIPPDRIWIETDDVKLLQVINNLISNALKFTRQGGIIAIRLEETDGSLLVTVRDDGIGIPEEHHPFLFEEFTKARRKGLKGEETVGLGLSITKKLVEIQGGKIWFESSEGEGTAFFVEIPKA